jgi:hypothetical protein
LVWKNENLMPLLIWKNENNTPLLVWKNENLMQLLVWKNEISTYYFYRNDDNCLGFCAKLNH